MNSFWKTGFGIQDLEMFKDAVLSCPSIVGDKLVIAPSSFEWTDAEEVTVMSCAECNDHELMVQGRMRQIL